MTARIPGLPPPAPSLQPMAVARADQQGSAADFASLLLAFRGDPANADFLGRAVAGAGGTAKPFNADGFFSRLEAIVTALARPSRTLPTEAGLQSSPRSVEAAGDRPVAGRPAIAHPFLSSAPMLATSGIASARHPQPQSPGAVATSPRAAVMPAPPPAAELDQAAPAESAAPASQDQSGTRLRVLVEGSAIHIAGAGELSRDEEARLVEQITELLLEHGQSGSGVWLNGRRIAQAHKEQR